MHLERAAAITGRMPERLMLPPVPAVFDRALRLWTALASHRETGGMSVASFSWRDFAAFQDVTGERLSKEDITGIDAIETAFFESRAAAQKVRDAQRERERANG